MELPKKLTQQGFESHIGNPYITSGEESYSTVITDEHRTTPTKAAFNSQWIFCAIKISSMPYCQNTL